MTETERRYPAVGRWADPTQDEIEAENEHAQTREEEQPPPYAMLNSDLFDRATRRGREAGNDAPEDQTQRCVMPSPPGDIDLVPPRGHSAYDHQRLGECLELLPQRRAAREGQHRDGPRRAAGFSTALSASRPTVGRHNRSDPDGRPVTGSRVKLGNVVPQHRRNEPCNSPGTEPPRSSAAGSPEASSHDPVTTHPIPVMQTAAPRESPWFTPGQPHPERESTVVGTIPIDASDVNALGEVLTAMWGTWGHALDEQT